MPTTLEQLQNNILATQTVLQNASTDANNALSDLNRCVCGSGKEAFGAGKCTPYSSTVSFPNRASASNCTDKPPLNNCKTDCCKKSTCVERVSAYNSKLDNFVAATSNYNSAKKAYDDFVKSNPVIAAQVQAQQAQIATEQANRKTRNFVIILVVSALVLVLGFILYKKYSK